MQQHHSIKHDWTEHFSILSVMHCNRATASLLLTFCTC